MKYIFVLILIIVINTFSSAQSIKEEKKIEDYEGSYQIMLKYYISDDEYDNLVQDVTSIMGESLGADYWASPKEKEKYVVVKIMNNYLWVRGYDDSEDQTLKSTLVSLNENLQKYSETPSE